jgi:hypothetical protein
VEVGGIRLAKGWTGLVLYGITHAVASNIANAGNASSGWTELPGLRCHAGWLRSSIRVIRRREASGAPIAPTLEARPGRATASITNTRPHHRLAPQRGCAMCCRRTTDRQQKMGAGHGPSPRYEKCAGMNRTPGYVLAAMWRSARLTIHGRASLSIRVSAKQLHSTTRFQAVRGPKLVLIAPKSIDCASHNFSTRDRGQMVDSENNYIF